MGRSPLAGGLTWGRAHSPVQSHVGTAASAVQRERSELAEGVLCGWSKAVPVHMMHGLSVLTSVSSGESRRRPALRMLPVVTPYLS